ncbi:hypothetical protein Micbo1qcDRAFT_213468 [Microdochium bolleyi]|uniref:F-box domain-containing protein n=1 Tax=Microdochium bolleyi TaxID=196109 RepID=A0A136IW56_9PEZI|nr:hypothetical protein Micbo1qcDRAFT_213468 [Microdochium bolleyi]
MGDEKKTFLDLPGEIRNQIYKLALIQDEPIHVTARYGLDIKLNTALFRACKIVHDEASALFYSQNQIDCTGMRTIDVKNFLHRIGPTHACQMSSMVIDLPDCQMSMEFQEIPSVVFRESSKELMTSIKDYCVALTNIVVRVENSFVLDVIAGEALVWGDPENAGTAFTMVNTQLRAIGSLKTIMVEVFEGLLSECEYIRELITRCGWVVQNVDFFPPLNDSELLLDLYSESDSSIGDGLHTEYDLQPEYVDEQHYQESDSLDFDSDTAECDENDLAMTEY